MDLIKNIGRAVGRAAESLGEKHRRVAGLNRIRTVIRCEERAAEKEYLALGRYYYNALRDRNNAVTEPHCQALDGIEERLEKALDWMQTFSSDNGIGFISDDGDCPCGDEECEEITLDDVECLDEEPVLEMETVVESEEEPEETGSLPFEG